MNALSKNQQIKTPNSVLLDIGIVAVATALLLLIPLLARFDWTMFDFIAAWILLFSAGITFRLITRKTINKAHTAATLVAVGTALFMVWANLAVGLIGSENNPINLMYAGVLAVLIIGSIIVKFKPAGMTIVLVLTAIAQIIAALIVFIGDFGTMREIIGVNGFFLFFWIISALLFRFSAMGLDADKSENPE